MDLRFLQGWRFGNGARRMGVWHLRSAPLSSVIGGAKYGVGREYRPGSPRDRGGQLLMRLRTVQDYVRSVHASPRMLEAPP